MITKLDSRYVKVHDAEHVIAGSQDFEENRCNETATGYNHRY